MFQPLIPIEVKRKHILEYIGESFIEFHKHNKKAQSGIRQIYSYMVVNQVKYSILSTYDNHWFLRRPGDNEENRDKLWISEALPLQSHSPPVLKVNIRKSAQKKESSDSSSRSSSDASTSTNNQNLYFTDFKFKDMLSQGQKMQNEVRIYQLLSDLQDLPNLECYGYFENEWQKVKGILVLKAIHDRGILHNDIRGENILLDNRNNDVYLIDFGMSSSYYDVKKSWRLFNEEKLKLNSVSSIMTETAAQLLGHAVPVCQWNLQNSANQTTTAAYPRFPVNVREWIGFAQNVRMQNPLPAGQYQVGFTSGVLIRVKEEAKARLYSNVIVPLEALLIPQGAAFLATPVGFLGASDYVLCTNNYTVAKMPVELKTRHNLNLCDYHLWQIYRYKDRRETYPIADIWSNGL
ncbi:hypothetical protein RhiirA5_415435 [Rhizophagus irregularis]|uniref:Protein kinase domain-containing protein n=1 Tax=Rhizophagus irregularis TaxID=588596 RepID=A0A2N0PRZ4_9GLOM|nr:hypothetical protein RhiirA5_415435 [Rhizophagus irregularis]